MSALVKLAIAAFLIVAVLALIALLPTLSLDKNTVITSSAWQWIVAAAYFVPTRTVAAIGTITLAFWTWRMIVVLVKTLWDLLPVA